MLIQGSQTRLSNKALKHRRPQKKVKIESASERLFSCNVPRSSGRIASGQGGSLNMQYSQIRWLLVVTTLVLIVGIVSFVSPAKASETEDASVPNKRVRHVKKVKPGETLTGKATLYPNSLNGRETASGDIFHQSGHTAASNKLPLGTHVKVTNLKNGKSTKVTTNDHGPALGSHKIDLSKRAAEDIGLTGKQGKVPVEIKVIRPPNNGAN